MWSFLARTDARLGGPRSVGVGSVGTLPLTRTRSDPIRSVGRPRSVGTKAVNKGVEIVTFLDPAVARGPLLGDAFRLRQCVPRIYLVPRIIVGGVGGTMRQPLLGGFCRVFFGGGLGFFKVFGCVRALTFITTIVLL